MRTNRVLRGDFGWVGLHVCLLHKINPQANEKLFAVGKNGPNATFDLFFLGLGWPWVVEFVGSTIIFICFPTHQNLAIANTVFVPVSWLVSCSLYVADQLVYYLSLIHI